MKNNFIRVALLLALVLAFAGGARAQTNLAAGDIAIVGITRGSSPAKLSIVALRNISAGTKIYISDYGYDESTGVFGTASLTGTSSQAEGVITWTPSATVDAGTLYTIAITPHATSPSVSGLPGTVTVSGWSNTTASPISGGGDNWFIYQGSSPTSVTTFVFAWTNTFVVLYGGKDQVAGQFVQPGSGAPNNMMSYLPPSLTLGTSAIALNRDPNSGGYHGDNNRYKGTTTGTQAQLLAAICTIGNWDTSETTVYDIAAGGFYSVNPSFTVVTPATTPAVSSPTSADLTHAAATLGGNVTSDGGATITERGVVYSATTSNADPVIGGASVVKLVATGTTGSFTTAASGLSASTNYTFKAYATNSVGTSYTTAASFTTSAPPDTTPPTHTAR